MANSIKATRYLFTLNNWTAIEYNKLKKFGEGPTVGYMIMGKEGVQPGKTPHIQGYLELKRSQRFSFVKKMMPRAHWTRANGTAQQNIDYCSKEDKHAWFTGMCKKTPAEAGRMKGAAAVAMAKEGKDWFEILEAFPDYCSRYSGNIKGIINDFKEKKEREAGKASMEATILYEWQKEIKEALESQGPRKIMWLFDLIGGTGKTHLCKYLTLVCGALYIENAKKADIAFHWNFEEVIVCNLTRDKEGKTNYSTLESLKDGAIFSGKYKPVSKLTGKQVKILVAANWLPQLKMMSLDRWDIVEMKKDLSGVTTLTHWSEDQVKREFEAQQEREFLSHN